MPTVLHFMPCNTSINADAYCDAHQHLRKAIQNRHRCPSNYVFPLSASLHQCSILIFIYKTLLPEGQTIDAWKDLTKSNAISEIGQSWISNFTWYMKNDKF
jgi:hypothetical protein